MFTIVFLPIAVISRLAVSQRSLLSNPVIVSMSIAPLIETIITKIQTSNISPPSYSDKMFARATAQERVCCD